MLITVMANNLNEAAQIPKIWETEEEKLLTIGQLKYHYRQIAKHKFQGKVFKVIVTIRKGIDDIAKFRYYTLKKIKFILRDREPKVRRGSVISVRKFCDSLIAPHYKFILTQSRKERNYDKDMRLYGIV